MKHSGDNGMSDSFLTNVLANVVADLIAGVVLGGILTWWIGKMLNQTERVQQRQEAKRSELEKAIRYLELLRGEIAELLPTLPNLLNEFRETGWGREIRLPTPLWDVLQPSGELPRLIDPSLLSSLTSFYDHLGYAKRGLDLVIESWLIPHPNTVPGMGDKSQAFLRMTEWGLDQAIAWGKDLEDKLNSGIGDLKTQLNGGWHTFRPRA